MPSFTPSRNQADGDLTVDGDIILDDGGSLKEGRRHYSVYF